MIVTVDDAKEYLRIDSDNEDDVLENLIKMSQTAAEDYCRVAFETAYQVIPEPVKLAVLLMVSHYYENRDNSDKQVYIAMRIAFQNLLYPYRDPTQMF